MKVASRRAEDCQGGIYARKGEKTYCENGHLLGTFARDVEMGALPETGDITVHAPMEMGVSKCPHCSGAVTGDQFGSVYFFEVLP